MRHDPGRRETGDEHGTFRRGRDDPSQKRIYHIKRDYFQELDYHFLNQKITQRKGVEAEFLAQFVKS